MSLRRWPLHPAPLPGEALTSWLNRIAGAYGLTVADLVGHNLGPASLVAELAGVEVLDRQAPPGVIGALHDRTGVGVQRIREKTVTGWAPWLLDPVDTDLAASPAASGQPHAGGNDDLAYQAFAQQTWVLLRPGEARPRTVPGWRPWLGAKPMRRACPTCALATTAYTLLSQLPVTLGCPEHGQLLLPVVGWSGSTTFWSQEAGEGADGERWAFVDPWARVMDLRTHEALDNGTVQLPGRAIHAGVWFRLLRTLLHEISVPVSDLTAASRRLVRSVWDTLGLPCRGGQNAWKPFESLTWPGQQQMLCAAATALHLIETRAVTSHGPFADVLAPPTAGPVGDGDRPHPLALLWGEIHQQIDECVAQARTDPAAGADLMRMFTTFCQQGDTLDSIRRSFIELGVGLPFGTPSDTPTRPHPKPSGPSGCPT